MLRKHCKCGLDCADKAYKRPEICECGLNCADKTYKHPEICECEFNCAHKAYKRPENPHFIFSSHLYPDILSGSPFVFRINFVRLTHIPPTSQYILLPS